MVPLMYVLGLPPASRGLLGIKLRRPGPPLSVRVLLLSPCFCLWLIFLSLCGAGSILFFSHLSLNLSTDVISLKLLVAPKKDIISRPLVSSSHLSCVWLEECRIWILWEMTSGYVSCIPCLLGSTADTCTCVSLQRYLANPDFPREGGLRILRSMLAGLSVSVLVFGRPCTEVQGRGPCPQGHGPRKRCILACVWTNTHTLMSRPHHNHHNHNNHHNHSQNHHKGSDRFVRSLFFSVLLTSTGVHWVSALLRIRVITDSAGRSLLLRPWIAVGADFG